MLQADCFVRVGVCRKEPFLLSLKVVIKRFRRISDLQFVVLVVSTYSVR